MVVCYRSNEKVIQKEDISHSLGENICKTHAWYRAENPEYIKNFQSSIITKQTT